MPISIQMEKYGGPEVLIPRDNPVPTPGPNELVIKTSLAPVNRADCEIRSGKWSILAKEAFPYVPGIEVSGTVFLKGKNANFDLGTPVITMMQKLGGIHGIRRGGYQEYVLVPADTVAIIDELEMMEDIAILGLAAVTAFNGLRKLNGIEGKKVIVMGASGSVGSVAVQIAKTLGAYVIAGTNGSGKKESLIELGVDEVWNSQQEWSRDKVDAVLEMVGGGTFGSCVSALKRGGRLCSIGALTGGTASLSIWNLLHDLELTGWSSENMSCKELQITVSDLAKMLKENKIQLPPVTYFDLSDAAKAHEFMENGSRVGRVVLKPSLAVG